MRIALRKPRCLKADPARCSPDHSQNTLYFGLRDVVPCNPAMRPGRHRARQSVAERTAKAGVARPWWALRLSGSSPSFRPGRAGGAPVTIARAFRRAQAGLRETMAKEGQG